MVPPVKSVRKVVSPVRTTLRPGGVRKRPSLGHRAALSIATKSMRVIVRVRPQSQKEKNDVQKLIVKTLDEKMLIFDPKEEATPFYYHGKANHHRDLLKKENKAMEFMFDRVFDETSSNKDVFEGSTKNLITRVLDGYNCSVFVYGATGAGKTYTMLGNCVDPGITYLTMVELHHQMAVSTEWRFEMWVSYLEIYNENVRDLLSTQVNGEQSLKLQEDRVKGIIVAGLVVKSIQSADELLDLLSRGNQNRTQHPTDANAESSRSHAVFQVCIRMTNKLTSQVKQVKLSMIDLAGSERAAATGSKGARFTEGANINKSLLALGNCINSLADGRKHIPFRDSKLTRLLKDSLGGNCHTVMIANISPAPLAYEDTYNTLKYAARAKKIKSMITRNVVSVELHVNQYKDMIHTLKLKLAEQEKKLKMLEDQNAKSADVASSLKMNQEAIIASLKTELENTKLELNMARNQVLESRELNTMVQLAENIAQNADQETITSAFKDRLKKCYGDKIKLHRDIMNLERKIKSVNYRQSVKVAIGIRVKQRHHFDEDSRKQVLLRICTSLNQFKGQIETYKKKLSKCWEKKIKCDKQLSMTIKEAEEMGLGDVMSRECAIHNILLKENEGQISKLHLQQLCVLQQQQLESQDKLTIEKEKLLSKCFLLLQGHQVMTNQLHKEFEMVGQMVDGAKGVSWGQVHVNEDDESDFVIPPQISDIMLLPFDGSRPHLPDDPNNISQLNYSKEECNETSISPSLNLSIQTAYEFVEQVSEELEVSTPCGSVGETVEIQRPHFNATYVCDETELGLDSTFSITPKVEESKHKFARNPSGIKYRNFAKQSPQVLHSKSTFPSGKQLTEKNHLAPRNIPNRKRVLEDLPKFSTVQKLQPSKKMCLNKENKIEGHGFVRPLPSLQFPKSPKLYDTVLLGKGKLMTAPRIPCAPLTKNPIVKVCDIKEQHRDKPSPRIKSWDNFTRNK